MQRLQVLRAGGGDLRDDGAEAWNVRGRRSPQPDGLVVHLGQSSGQTQDSHLGMFPLILPRDENPKP